MAIKPKRRDPLDVPDEVYGQNPRELSRAVRRSAERAGTPVARAQPTKATERPPTPRSRREEQMTGRKGGPGKRRPTPKKGAPGRGRPGKRH